jgi:hypothetical protein
MFFTIVVLHQIETLSRRYDTKFDEQKEYPHYGSSVTLMMSVPLRNDGLLEQLGEGSTSIACCPAASATSLCAQGDETCLPP